MRLLLLVPLILICFACDGGNSNDDDDKMSVQLRLGECKVAETTCVFGTVMNPIYCRPHSPGSELGACVRPCDARCQMNGGTCDDVGGNMVCRIACTSTTSDAVCKPTEIDPYASACLDGVCAVQPVH